MCILTKIGVKHIKWNFHSVTWVMPQGGTEFLMILFLPKCMINVTTLILKLLMFLALHFMESISLSSFLLVEHLAMLRTSALAITC